MKLSDREVKRLCLKGRLRGLYSYLDISKAALGTVQVCEIKLSISQAATSHTSLSVKAALYKQEQTILINHSTINSITTHDAHKTKDVAQARTGQSKVYRPGTSGRTSLNREGNMRDKLACAAFIWAIIAKSGGDVVFWDLLLWSLCCGGWRGERWDRMGYGAYKARSAPRKNVRCVCVKGVF